VMSLDTRRKVAMLRWFGKIQRMSETRLVKKMFNEVNYVWVGKGRARRKTWKKWVDVIVDDFEIREQFEQIAEFSEKKRVKVMKNAAMRYELKCIEDKSSKCHNTIVL